jgi:hypothetical protein
LPFKKKQPEEQPVVNATSNKKKKSFFTMLREEFKDDPESMKMLIPVPDYGALNAILLMKVLDELRKNDKK